MSILSRSLFALSILAITLCAAAGPVGAQPTDLVLCLDTSGSMNQPVAGSQLSRWDIERDGSAAAVLDPAVIPHDGTIRLTVIQFSNSAKVEVSPTEIDSQQVAQDVADKIKAIKATFGSTNPAACIALAAKTIAAAPSFPGRKVIDVSTDGLPNVPDIPQGKTNAIAEAQAAIAAGFDAVNALGIVLNTSGTAFLEDLVQPQPAGGDEGFVVSISDALEYQQKLAEKIVRETTGSCAIVGDVEILCPGDGGDKLTLTLTVTNLSEDEIHHLFVLEDPANPLPPGVVLLDDYFDLSTDPLCAPQTDPTCDRSGATATIEVEVRGQPGETFNLLLTLHNQDLSECCSLSVPIELPACDCAQLLDETVSCRLDFSGGKLVNRWDYGFTLQNLTGQTVEHVLMTPISPQAITFTPPFFLNLGLAPVSPVGGGAAGPLRTIIGGAAAQVGQEVCFHLSTHTAAFDTCCAIERCVTLPACFIPVGSVSYDPIGNTHLNFRENRLVVSGFGPSGDDGLAISVPPAERVGIGFEPPASSGPRYLLDLGARGTVNGRPDRPVVGVKAFDSPPGTRLVPRTLVGAVRGVEVRRAGETVGTFRLHGGQGITVPSRFACQDVLMLRETSSINVIVIWPRAVAIRPDGADGEEVVGDEVIFHTALRSEVDGITRVNLRARAIPELVITGFDLQPITAPELEP